MLLKLIFCPTLLLKHKLIQSFIYVILCNFRLSLLKRHFEPIYKKNSEAVKTMHSQATAQLTENIQVFILYCFTLSVTAVTIQSIPTPYDLCRIQSEDIVKCSISRF